MFDNSFEIINKNFIETEPFVKINEILEISFKKKLNGEIIGIVKNIYGETIIKTISPNGAVLKTMIKVPNFYSMKERDEYILELYKNKKFSQVDIAIFMGLSQSQVSYILKKFSK